MQLSSSKQLTIEKSVCTKRIEGAGIRVELTKNDKAQKREISGIQFVSIGIYDKVRVTIPESPRPRFPKDRPNT